MENTKLQSDQLATLFRKIASESNLSIENLLIKLNEFVDSNLDTIDKFKTDFVKFIQFDQNGTIEEAINNDSLNIQSSPDVVNQIVFKEEPDDTNHYLKRAIYHRDLKEYDEALKYVDESIKEKPNNSEVHNEKGMVLACLEDHTNAIESFNKAIDLDSSKGYFYSNKAFSLFKLKRFNEVIDIYSLKSIICKLKGDDWYYLGRAYMNKNQYLCAFECFENAIECEPEEPNFYYGKADALFYLKEGDKSIECYEMAISLNSSNADYYASLGNALTIFKGDYKYALENIEKALIISKKPLYYYYKGLAYCKMYSIINKKTIESFNKAKELYDKIDDIDTIEHGFLCDMGSIYVYNNCFNKALSIFKKLIQLDSFNGDAYYGCGLVYYERKGHTNDYKRALDCFNKAIELFLPQNKYESLIDCYNHVIKIDSNNAKAQFNKGRILKLLNRFYEAKESFRNAMNLKSDFVEAKEQYNIVDQYIPKETNDVYEYHSDSDENLMSQ